LLAVEEMVVDGGERRVVLHGLVEAIGEAFLFAVDDVSAEAFFEGKIFE